MRRDWDNVKAKCFLGCFFGNIYYLNEQKLTICLYETRIRL